MKKLLYSILALVFAFSLFSVTQANAAKKPEHSKKMVKSIKGKREVAHKWAKKGKKEVAERTIRVRKLVGYKKVGKKRVAEYKWITEKRPVAHKWVKGKKAVAHKTWTKGKKAVWHKKMGKKVAKRAKK